MDDIHRRKILENLDKLVEGISSFEELFNELSKRRVFNSWMEDEILNKEDTKKLRFLYWYVTTRGPGAFDQLCEAFRELQHNELADHLTNYRPSRVHPFQNGNASSEPDLEEEYPYDKEWTVTLGRPGTDEFDYDLNKVYTMRSSPRGLALVINIRTYVNKTLDTRFGSEKDVARLESILPQLGYKVTVVEDLTAEEILKEMKKFSKMEEHSWCDSAMVIVMSHGLQLKGEESSAVAIAGSDLVTVLSQDLVEILSARKCEALRGKPKIFFFQVCRGDQFNYSVTAERRNTVEEQNTVNVEVTNGLTNGHSVDVQMGQDNTVQTDGIMMGQTCLVRSDSDVLIGHATSPGMYSMRDMDTGTWYIQTLCRVFAKHAWHEDLHSMLQTVDRTIKSMDYCGAKQTCTFYDRHPKRLYFQPGIYN